MVDAAIARTSRSTASCVSTARSAFALSKVYTMLTPSMGFCLMPSTISGALMPAASRIVGTMSMT